MVLLCTRYTKFQCLPGLANTIQAVTWQQEKEGGGEEKGKKPNSKEIYKAYETCLV